jgi:RimJ/RimL family protein N-acetyltransferase
LEKSVVFGLINIHPRYHRTHVNTHAMSLVLGFLFDDLHLVRVQYDAVTFNEASIKAAMRFGFKEEGVCRNFNGIVPNSKKRQDEKHLVSQDMLVSSMTDYEWETEGREKLRKMMERKPVDSTRL